MGSELERAREHMFIAGLDDSGAKLCAANVPYGLAKLHHAQRKLGAPADACFVGAPDCTVTRNRRRWRQGFGYGGCYSWTGDFAVLDIKPNACGMLCGALPATPELDQVRARLRQLDREGLQLDGVAIDNDLCESNHFVDVLELAGEQQHEPAPHGAKSFFIMHSSGHEHRGASSRGPGLYYDQSDELRAMARRVDTPWGSLHILEGSDAADWFAFYQRAQDFNHRRREALARYLFGDFDVVVNATHQGLVRGVNRANLGCYTFDRGDGDAPLFPLTLSPTLPAFLVRGHASFSDAAIAALGWDERLERHRLREPIAQANILPHGGGYRFDNFRGVARVIDDEPDNRRFVLEPTASNRDALVIAAPDELSFGYRGLEVKTRLEELDLGRVVLALDLQYVLTA